MITFGTDGWRARIGEDFNEQNVETLASSVCQYLVEAGNVPSENRLVVGYDTRRDSEAFASKVANIASSIGFAVLMPDRDTPTPAIAFSVRHWKACGGIMITASHNPPDWNGMKFIPSYAGPANESITSRTQNLISQETQPKTDQNVQGEITRIDPFPPYFEQVRAMLGAVALSTSGIKVVYDPMHATGRGYIDRLLRSFGVDVTTINADPDPNFGGIQPDPTEEHLSGLMDAVVETGAQIGLATDGDGDRISAVGPNRQYISPNMLFPLLAQRAQDRKRGGIVRTVATTAAVDALAAKLKVPVFEVPVGFKYIAPYLVEQKAVIGGEESGGFGFWDHVPEKDGILSSLRIVELLAQKHATIMGLLDGFAAEFGPFVTKRTQVALTEAAPEKLGKIAKDLESLAKRKVSRIVKTDGLKLYFEEGGWLLVRPSGTEPVARIYAEASSKEEVDGLLEAGRTLFAGS